MQPAIEPTRFTDDFRRFLKLISEKTSIAPSDVIRGHSTGKGHTRARQLLIFLMVKRGHSKTDIANAFSYTHSGVDALIRQFEQVRDRYATIINEAIPHDPPTGNPIIDAVSEATGVPAEAICTHTRTVPIVNARHMALVLFSELNPRADDTQCAQFVKRKHLTTTKEARAKVAHLYANDQEFREAMDRAREILSKNQ